MADAKQSLLGLVPKLNELSRGEPEILDFIIGSIKGFNQAFDSKAGRSKDLKTLFSSRALDGYHDAIYEKMIHEVMPQCEEMKTKSSTNGTGKDDEKENEEMENKPEDTNKVTTLKDMMAVTAKKLRVQEERNAENDKLNKAAESFLKDLSSQGVDIMAITRTNDTIMTPSEGDPITGVFTHELNYMDEIDTNVYNNKDAIEKTDVVQDDIRAFLAGIRGDGSITLVDDISKLTSKNRIYIESNPGVTVTYQAREEGKDGKKGKDAKTHVSTAYDAIGASLFNLKDATATELNAMLADIDLFIRAPKQNKRLTHYVLSKAEGNKAYTAKQLKDNATRSIEHKIYNAHNQPTVASIAIIRSLANDDVKFQRKNFKEGLMRDSGRVTDKNRNIYEIDWNILASKPAKVVKRTAEPAGNDKPKYKRVPTTFSIVGFVYVEAKDDKPAHIKKRTFTLSVSLPRYNDVVKTDELKSVEQTTSKLAGNEKNCIVQIKNLDSIAPNLNLTELIKTAAKTGRQVDQRQLTQVIGKLTEISQEAKKAKNELTEGAVPTDLSTPSATSGRRIPSDMLDDSDFNN